MTVHDSSNIDCALYGMTECQHVGQGICTNCAGFCTCKPKLDEDYPIIQVLTAGLATKAEQVCVAGMLSALQEQVKALREWACHDRTCPEHLSYEGDDEGCTCGLAQALGDTND
jgi:hypothetical protein